jgi:hypothetical protein
MISNRNKKGEVIVGRGSELSGKQTEFITRVAEEGLDRAAAISREMSYTSYYRDRRNVGTAFHKELMKLVDSEQKSIEAAKGMNLNKLITIRDMAISAGDMKVAMEAIKIMNSMQGHNAPKEVKQTKLDITATIDLTAPVEEEDGYLDIYD